MSKSISDLTAADALSGDMAIPVATENGRNRKVTLSQLGSTVPFSQVTGAITVTDISSCIIASSLTSTTTAITCTSSGSTGDVGTHVTLFLTQGTGSNVVTWSSNVKWPTGIAPALSFEAGATDVFSLITYDHGVTWFGFLNGSWVE